MSTARKDIDERGFAILANVFSQPEMEQLAGDVARSSLRRSKAGIRHALQHHAIHEMATGPKLLGLARSILSPDAFPFKATLFDKSARTNWLVVWHQDTALPIRVRHQAEGWGPWSVKDGVIYAHAPATALNRVLALRVHLDDSGADNGPLRVLPGTHTRGVLTDEEIEEVEKISALVDCLVPQGGVLAMKPLIVHASSKSESSTPRRVVHIEYCTCNAFPSGLELAVT
jgi:hypothetical protein